MKGARRRGRQKKRWEDNIKEWTGMGFGDSLRAAEEGWKGIVATSSVVPRRPPMLRDWDENFRQIHRLKFELSILPMQNLYSELFFVHKILICCPISKIFAAHFMTNSGLNVDNKSLIKKHNPGKYILRDEFYHINSSITCIIIFIQYILQMIKQFIFIILLCQRHFGTQLWCPVRTKHDVSIVITFSRLSGYHSLCLFVFITTTRCKILFELGVVGVGYIWLLWYTWNICAMSRENLSFCDQVWLKLACSETQAS